MGYTHPGTRCSLTEVGLETPRDRVEYLSVLISIGGEEAPGDKGIRGGRGGSTGVQMRGVRGCCGCLGLCIEACDIGRGWAEVCVMLSPRLCDIISVSLGCHCGSCGWGIVWCGCGPVRVLGGMDGAGAQPRVPTVVHVWVIA